MFSGALHLERFILKFGLLYYLASEKSARFIRTEMTSKDDLLCSYFNLSFAAVTSNCLQFLATFKMQTMFRAAFCFYKAP